MFGKTFFTGTLAILAIAPLTGCHRPTTTVQLEKWSDAKTWQGNIPKQGDIVVIPKGKRVFLDVSPPKFARIEVEGELQVADSNLTLQSEVILVSGDFVIGTEKSPLQKPFHLVLDTSHQATNPDAGLFFVNGHLSVFGKKLPHSWTKLDGSISAKTDHLKLASSLPVEPGDKLLVVATGFNPNECEVVDVESSNQSTIHLSRPVKYNHFGQVTYGVDERAEVGILNRNIVVEGVGTPMQGGHLMVSNYGSATIDGAEFVHMGQSGKLARYPIHFHMAGDQSRSFVRNVSIHDCFNRALTIHGTHNLQVSDCIAYRSYGHLIFLEDGVETGNKLTRNLAARALVPPAKKNLLHSDLDPSCFWVTNPQNDLIGNVSAASDGEGYWLAFPKTPTGPSAKLAENKEVKPRRTSLGIFDSNVTHSNSKNGLFVDGEANPPGVYDIPSYDPKTPATFSGLTSYKNQKRGAWLRGSNLILAKTCISDNPIGVTLAASNSYLKDSLIVGESENGKGIQKVDNEAFPVRGFEFYDGLVGLSKVKFVNFVPNRSRQSSALSALRFSPYFIDPNSYVENLTFENAKPVYFDHVHQIGTGARSADGYRTVAFRDIDGSLTGSRNSYVTIANPFLENASAKTITDWNAMVSTSHFGRLFVDSINGSPDEMRSCIIKCDSHPAATHRMGGTPFEGGSNSYQTMVVPSESYTMSFQGGVPPSIRFSLRYLEPDESITLHVRYPYPDFQVFADKNSIVEPGKEVNGISYTFDHQMLTLVLKGNSKAKSIRVLANSI